MQVAELALSKHRHLRKHRQPSDYTGVDGAKKMLNNMIFESASKYDQEIAKCTEYYAKQCSLMQQARGQISASNYVAANSRASILQAQGTIGRCEKDIPTREMELSQHNEKCAEEKKQMEERLKVILADIDVMTTILKMTECGQGAFVQGIRLMKCTDACTKKSFLSFEHKGLDKYFGKLKSDLSHKLTR